MMRACIVYNPAAGRYPSGLLAERAARVLQDRGWEVSLDQARSAEHIAELAAQAAADDLDVFFVAGGDGSLNCALPGLVGTQTALAVLPAGTANVWAQELGLPGLTWTRWMALEESAARLAQGEIRCIDVGQCNNRPFLLWAGVGLDAFIVHRIEPRRPWEKHFSAAYYTASAIWKATEWHGMQFQAEVDGHPVSGRFLLAVVSNVHLYAGGYAQLSPNARLDDSLMDLWLFKGENLGDTVQFAWNLLSGQHQTSDRVLYYPFRNIELGGAVPMYIQVDGEPLNFTGNTTIQVLPKALRVLVPKETPHPLFQAEE